MRPLHDILGHSRVRVVDVGRDGAALEFTAFGGTALNVIVSWGGGWEHASVTHADEDIVLHPPSWDSMQRVRFLVFDDRECVMQLHPPVEENINHHPGCLHLWRPIGAEIPMPPKCFV